MQAWLAKFTLAAKYCLAAAFDSFPNARLSLSNLFTGIRVKYGQSSSSSPVYIKMVPESYLNMHSFIARMRKKCILAFFKFNSNFSLTSNF